jgi:hypothetical protein
LSVLKELLQEAVTIVGEAITGTWHMRQVFIYAYFLCVEQSCQVEKVHVPGELIVAD